MMRRASPIPSSSSFLVLQVPRCMFNRRVAAAPSDACERDSIRSSPPPPQSSGHGGCLQSAQKRGHHTMQCAKCPYHPSSRRHMRARCIRAVSCAVHAAIARELRARGARCPRKRQIPCGAKNLFLRSFRRVWRGVRGGRRRMRRRERTE